MAGWPCLRHSHSRSPKATAAESGGGGKLAKQQPAQYPALVEDTIAHFMRDLNLVRVTETAAPYCEIVKQPHAQPPPHQTVALWPRPGRQHFKVDSADLWLAVGGPGQAECPTAWLRKIYDVGTARIGQDRLRFT